MADGKTERNMLGNNVNHHSHKRKHQQKPLCACTAYSLNKLFVFLYAFLFFIVGAILLIVGVWSEVVRRQFRWLDSQLAVPIALLIIVGLFIAINAIMGMFGALKENLTLLRLFLAFTVIAFCAQIVVGTVSFILREKVSERGHDYFLFAMREYTNNDNIQGAVDHLQTTYTCCGLDSYDDYNYNMDYACNSNSSVACGVPVSCCKVKEGKIRDKDCGLGIRGSDAVEISVAVHREGCLKKFRTWLVNNFDILGAMILGWAIPQIFGMLLIYFFIRRVYDMHAWYRVNAY